MDLLMMCVWSILMHMELRLFAAQSYLILLLVRHSADMLAAEVCLVQRLARQEARSSM